jgi:hypothetical protein
MTTAITATERISTLNQGEQPEHVPIQRQSSVNFWTTDDPSSAPENSDGNPLCINAAAGKDEFWFVLSSGL